MTIVFIGAVEFSKRALQRLLAIGANVVGVVTLKTSSFNADHVDLTPLCAASNIPCIYGSDINSDSTVAWIADRKPDVIFCFGWSRLLKQRLLQLAPLGVVGFHPTLLPSNRGRHPLIWALALGLTESGSTFFFMGEGADDGDILSQDRVRIDQSDDAGFLYEKITRCALGQIDAFVPQLASGSFTRVPQDHQRANSWRKREKADGRIDWRMGSLTIHNLVRALARPYPGAHFIHQGREVTVWKTEVVGGVESNIEPGRVIGVEATGPTVKCGERAIKLIETEPAFVPSIGEYL